MDACAQRDGDDVILDVYVQPRASRDAIVGIHDGALKIRITAAPVDGKANRYLQRFLAREFGVPAGSVSLLWGLTGRRKKFRIRKPARLPDGVDPS
ncbi:MAG: DUF167 family protein [Proteobacteria bacterium]|nr:DUF167 family protein [Pseudomonadota bacterium]